MIKRILGCAIAIMLISCGGSQKAAEKAVATAAKAKVIKAHQIAGIDFTTMQSRMAVNYQDENRSQAVTLDLRVEKGKHIWMSYRFLGATFAKASITPERVQFYEKLNKRSFDGDFSLVSQFLGEELNYQQLENLLLGQAIEPLNDLDFAIVDNKYQFKGGGLVARLFNLRPSDFKLAQQSIIKPSENSTLDIKYLEYQEVEGRILPAAIMINANVQGKLVQVDVNLEKVEFDQDVSFPFNLPSGYTPMEL